MRNFSSPLVLKFTLQVKYLFENVFKNLLSGFSIQHYWRNGSWDQGEKYSSRFFYFVVESLFVAAATIEIDEFFAQNLLSKNCVLLRLLFKGGYYLRAATNKDFTAYVLRMCITHA